MLKDRLLCFSKPLSLSVWAAITEYHRLGGLNTDIYFSQFWRLECSRSGCQPGWVWWRLSSWFGDGCPLTVSLRGGVKREKRALILSLYYKSINLIMRALSLWPNYLSKSPSPNTVTLGIRVSTFEFWETQTFSLSHHPCQIPDLQCWVLPFRHCFYSSPFGTFSPLQDWLWCLPSFMANGWGVGVVMVHDSGRSGWAYHHTNNGSGSRIDGNWNLAQP